MIERNDLFIGGRFVRALTADRVQQINPASEQIVGSTPRCAEADVDRAVDAARGALPSWRETSPQERASILTAIADGYERRGPEIGAMVALQNSSPRWWTEQENVRGPVHVYRAAAEMAAGLLVEELDQANGRVSIMRKEPIGVVGAIVPWNAPQILIAVKIAAALAAGCTVVAKPSPETSLDAYLLAEVFNAAGVPPGVANFVTGGPETGQAIVAHPGIDKIAFTGSTSAGRAIAAACGAALKPVTAELGGKSACLLLDDADLSLLPDFIRRECLPFSGQVCFSNTRILAPRSRHDEVRDLVVQTLEQIPFGDPVDPDVVMGPLVTSRQRDRVEAYLRSGAAEGARAVTGGGRPKGFSTGFYIEPTLFTDVAPSMRIFQEEIFGPVLALATYDDEDEAVALHNDCGFGLSGSVFSADLARASEVARRLETGALLVNGEHGSTIAGHSAYKNSGLGTEGVDRLGDYLQTKAISQPGSGWPTAKATRP